jgi:O-antigen ligase
MTGTSVFSKKNVYLFFILVFILSLFISPFILPLSIMSPFLNGPLLWLYGVTGIMLLVTALMLFTHRPLYVVVIKPNMPDILIGITLFYILIQQYFLNQPIYFTNKLLAYVCLTFVYFILKFYVSTLKHNRFKTFTAILISVILIITFVSCWYGLLQLYDILPGVNPDFKVTGNFYNPARYANYLVALLPFCISAVFLFPDDSKWYTVVKYTSAMVSLTGILVLPVTNTRAAWLGLSAAICVILYCRYKARAVKLLRNVWLMSSILIAGVFVIFLLYRLKPESASGRVTIWEISGTIVKQNPITGIGYGNFEAGYDNYQAKYFSESLYNEQKVQRADVVRYAYNVFLQVLCEQGLIGLILFVSLLYFLVAQAFFLNEKENKYGVFLTVASISSIIAILVCGQTSYPFDIVSVSIIFFINMALLSGINTNVSQQVNTNDNNKLLVLKVNVLRIVGVFSLGCSGIVFYFAETKFIAYKTVMETTYYNLNSNDISKVFPTLKSDIDFINIYSKKLLEEKKDKEVIKVLEGSRYMLMYPELYLTLAQAYAATDQYSRAEASFKTASNMVPNRFYSKYLWAKFYYETKQFNKAFNLSKIILTMKVKIPSSDVDEIKSKTKTILMECQKILNQNK